MNFSDYRKFRQLPVNIVTYLSFIKESFIRPSVVVIELTSMCNADCIMCGKGSSSRIKKNMDFTLFKSIIDDAKKSNVYTFQLSWYGESLIYPKLIDAILYIRKQIPDAFITINTNGQPLNPKLAKKLLDAKINSIAISIEGNNKEEYEAIRPPLKWDVLQSNIKNLRDMIDTNNFSTKVGIMGLHVGDIKIDKAKYVDTWGAYADTLHVRNEHALNDLKKENIINRYMPCRKLLTQLVIMASGDVTICDYDWEGELIYGNIKESTILELWQSEVLKKKRLMHYTGKKRKLDLCDNCSYRVDDPFKKSNLL